MDELRNQIWDLLYRSEGPQRIETVADQLGVQPTEVREAIEHHWFQVQDEVVEIAY